MIDVSLSDPGANLDEIWAELFPQGTLSAATIAAVPLLAAAVRTASARRDEIAWLVGMIADERHAYGDLLPEARAAVAALPLPPLDDPDPQVRAAAAYIVARAGGPVTALKDRLKTEDHPAVRPSLLLALGELDPELATARFPYDGPAAERYAAALALLRSGGLLPIGGAEAVTDAIDEGVEPDYAWVTREPVDELVLRASPTAAGDLVAALTRSPSADTRQAVAFAVAERALQDRSATRLVPLLSALRDDPDPGVRDELLQTLRSCGRAAAVPFRDWIAAVAGTLDCGAETIAVECLRLLGDPRWIDLNPTGSGLRPRWMTFHPDVLREARRALPRHPALAVQIGLWGRPAAEAASDLLALLPTPPIPDAVPPDAAAPDAVLPGAALRGAVSPGDVLTDVGREAARALARIGHAAPAALPYLRELAAEGDLDAAAAVRRLTGDAGPLLDALRTVFRGDAGTASRKVFGSAEAAAAHLEAESRRPRMSIRPPLLDPGDDLLPVVPDARAWLTGENRRGYDDRKVQILAAVVVVAATGDTAAVLPILKAMVDRRFLAVTDVAELVADLAGPDDDLLRRIDGVLAGGPVISAGPASDLIWIDEAIRARLTALIDRLRPAGPETPK